MEKRIGLLDGDRMVSLYSFVLQLLNLLSSYKMNPSLAIISIFNFIAHEESIHYFPFFWRLAHDTSMEVAFLSIDAGKHIEGFELLMQQSRIKADKTGTHVYQERKTIICFRFRLARVNKDNDNQEIRIQKMFFH
jgi:hypothetical protein